MSDKINDRYNGLIEAGVSPKVAQLHLKIIEDKANMTKPKNAWIEPVKFIHQDNVVDVSRMSLDNIRTKLAPGVYAPFIDDKGIHMRALKSRFEQSDHYGVEVERHLRMFSQDYVANGAVSVILLGQKGTGKSMTGEALCNYLIDNGVPVIYMDADIPGPVLHNLIRDVGKCALFIDEFDKRYQEYQQKNQLLSMFSDASLSDVSFIVAGNEKHGFSDFLLDRPTRFKYLIQFTGVSPYIVEEMCKKYKISKECSKLIMRYSCAHHASFDVMRTVIQTAAEVKSDIGELIRRTCYMNVPKFTEFTIQLMNVRSEQGMVSGVNIRQSPKGYDFTVIHEDGARVELSMKEVTNEAMVDRHFTIGKFRFSFRIKDSPYVVEDSLAATTKYTPEDITRVAIDPGSYKTFTLKKDDEEVVVSRADYNKQSRGGLNLGRPLPWESESRDTSF